MTVAKCLSARSVIFLGRHASEVRKLKLRYDGEMPSLGDAVRHVLNKGLGNTYN